MNSAYSSQPDADMDDSQAYVAAERAELEERAGRMRTEKNDRMLAAQLNSEQPSHETKDRCLAALITARECPCEEHDRLVAEEMARAPHHFDSVHLAEDWGAELREQQTFGTPTSRNTRDLAAQNSRENLPSLVSSQASGISATGAPHAMVTQSAAGTRAASDRTADDRVPIRQSPPSTRSHAEGSSQRQAIHHDQQNQPPLGSVPRPGRQFANNHHEDHSRTSVHHVDNSQHRTYNINSGHRCTYR